MPLPPSWDARFQSFARRSSALFGTHWAFLLALLSVVVWLITGPLFGFSETWQLVINTATTIVTFLMVFLIQATQNRESRALQLKLDELIRTSRARNAFAHLELATEEELAKLEGEFRTMRERLIEHRASKLSSVQPHVTVRNQGSD
jgi:low affinity Fe/Cu permease